MNEQFLPICRADMLARGWQEVDFVVVMGDAYVDPPSFGSAIIARLLEKEGWRVGIISQPDCRTCGSMKEYGRPRYGFFIGGGNVDSMVAHYSVAKVRRARDEYSPGGIAGKRPDRSATVYTRLAKQAYPAVPVVLGGLEASLRRFAHYDYWDDRVRRSILMDSQADLLMFGMGENTIIEVADALNSGMNIADICYIRGTVWKTKRIDWIVDDYIVLPSYEQVKSDKRAYAKSFMIQYENQDAINSRILIEPYDGWYVVCNQPPLPLTQEQMDFTYSLPYERTYHPKYHYVPAIEEVQFSITSNRGCFGACAFCAITSHQGRVISSRSVDSVVEEAKKITAMPAFKGYIHDVGGPSANFSRPACDKQAEHGACAKRQCLWPKPCTNLKVDHSHYVEMLDAVRALPGVKKVFIRSGIRYDYLMYDQDETFFDRLV